jgi:hypothetical protein
MRRIIDKQRSTTTAGGKSAGAATKKLVLQRETLRELTSRDLLEAAGGDVDPCSSSRTEVSFI